MELWQAILTTAITTVIGIIITDIVVRIKTSGKKYSERKAEERKKELKDIVSPLITDSIIKTLEPFAQEMATIKTEIKQTKEEIESVRKEIAVANAAIASIKNEDIEILKKATRDSLRNQLYTIYDRCIEYRTASDIENEAEMFNSYKALGGNHGCDDRHEIFGKLPTEDKYFYSQRNKKLDK